MNKLPSLTLSLAAMIVGLLGATALHFADLYGLNSEQMLWKLWNRLGWWWWSIPIITSAFGMYYMARLDRPVTTYGYVSRIIAFLAFIFYFYSWGNTGFGPAAAIMIPIAFVMVIRQRAVACEALRERPDYSQQPWLLRFYASLTTEMDETVK